MRTRTWLLALSTTALPAAFLGACGDSGNGTGGASVGGAGTTGSVTVGTTSHTSSTSHSSTATTGSTTTSGVTTASTTTATTGSTSSSGVGGMGPENCAAAAASAIALPVPGTHQVSGTTVGSTNDFNEFCASNGTATAPDAVYQFTTTADSTFTATLAEQGWNGVLELRQDCSVRSGFYQCFNNHTSGETLKTDLPAGTYFLVVDGSATTDQGAFNLGLTTATPECGDGVLNAGESCDPPNANSGCSATCQFMPTVASDTCAQAALAPITITAPSTTFYPMTPAPAFDNLGAADDYTPVTTADCPWNLPADPNDIAPDQVFQFHTGASVGAGTLTVEIGLDADGMTDACDNPANPNDPGCWNTGLFIRSACTDQTPAAQLACGIETNGVYTVTVNNVTANTDYFVFVKSNDSTFAPLATGPYYLKVGLN